MTTKSLVSRKKILELEKTLINSTDGVSVISDKGNVVRCDEFPLKHSFADGIYIRQMGMSKNSVVIGAIHNHLHAWFLLVGKITIVTDNTEEYFIAPCYVVSTPGVKRVIHANEESIFVNIHKNPSNTQDLNKLEAEIVSKNYKEYEKYINKNK